MIFFVLVAIFRVVTLVFYAAYDIRCVIFEQASVISCQQDALIPHEYAVILTLAWLVSSVFGSAVFLFVILYYPRHRKVFNFQCDKAKNMCKKGSLWYFAFLLLTAMGYHVYRTTLVRSAGIGFAISIYLFFWMFMMFCVVCCLNYTPRVQWRGKSCYKNFCERCRKNIFCYFYWISLATFFLEASYLWIAVALDVAHDVAPLIGKEYPEEPRIKGFIMIGLGFNLAFHSHLVSFFWDKIFHGDKDLLSDPGSKLIENKSNYNCVELSSIP